jgi:hypothetical protein
MKFLSEAKDACENHLMKGRKPSPSFMEMEGSAAEFYNTINNPWKGGKRLIL